MDDHAPAIQSLHERLPPQALRPLVTCVWIQQVAPGSQPYLHQTAPNGSAELVWTIGSDPKVVGPQTGPTATLLAPGTMTIGVRLRPAAVQAVLGVPARELVDLEVDAQDVCGRWVVALHNRLQEVSAPQAAAAVEAELSARYAATTTLDPIVVELVQRLLRTPDRNVRSLASSLYVSERQLRRRCEAAVGMPPKALQRIFRFQHVLARITTNEAGPDLGRLAYRLGYTDQSHLSRESLRLAGRPPGRLLHQSTRDCGCTHDHTASYRQFRVPIAT
jgi:AraC-like DNA-binding protein